MITLIKKHYRSIVTKIILALLVVSFAFWGLTNIFSNNVTRNTDIMTIGGYKLKFIGYEWHLGGQSISARDFEIELRHMLGFYRLSKNPDMARYQLFNIAQQAIRRLLEAEIVDGLADEVGIVISDELLKEHLTKIYQKEDGSFDQAKLDGFLAQYGYDKARYLRTLRTSMKHELLMQTLLAGEKLPKSFAMARYMSDYALRSGRYIEITKPTLDDLGTPPEAELQGLYEKHKDSLVTQEKRAFSMILVDRSTVENKIKVEQDSVNAYYQENKDDYYQNAALDLSLYQFKNKESADKAYQALTGLSIPVVDYIENTPSWKKSITDLGWVNEDEILMDTEVLELLKPGEISKVVGDDDKWRIYVLRGKREAKQRSFDEVKEEIHVQLLEDALLDKKESLMDEISLLEEEAKSLEEIAKEVGLDVVTFDAFAFSEFPKATSTSGKTQIFNDYDMAAKLFKMESGSVTTLEERVDGAVYKARVDSVVAPRQLTFDEVKSRLVDAWLASKKADFTNETQLLLQENMTQNKTLDDIATLVKNDGVHAIKPFNNHSLKNDNTINDKYPLDIEVLQKISTGFVGDIAFHNNDNAIIVFDIAPIDNAIALPNDKVIAQYAEMVNVDYEMDVRQTLIASLLQSGEISQNRDAIMQIIDGLFESMFDR